MECRICEFGPTTQSKYAAHLLSKDHIFKEQIDVLNKKLEEANSKTLNAIQREQRLEQEIVKANLENERAIIREEKANQEKEKERTERRNLQKEYESLKSRTLCEQEKLLFNQQSEKSNFDGGKIGCAKKQEIENRLFNQQSNFERDKIEYSKKLEEYEEKLRLKDLENQKLRERSSYNSISLSSFNKTSTSNISTTFDMKNISEVHKIEDMNTSDATVAKLAKDINSSTNTVNFGNEDSSHRKLEKSDEKIPTELDIKENKSKNMRNFRYT
jgi:hypothetical protein